MIPDDVVSELDRKSGRAIWIMGFGVAFLLVSPWFIPAALVGIALLVGGFNYSKKIVDDYRHYRPKSLDDVQNKEEKSSSFLKLDDLKNFTPLEIIPKKLGYANHDAWSEVSFWYETRQDTRDFREVDVKGVSYEKIRAYCHLRKALRTFRFDGIDDAFGIVNRRTGENISVWKWEKIIQGKWYLEQVEHILFVGFDGEKKASLEQLALDCRFKVRKKMTDTVNYVCLGENVPEKQLKPIQSSLAKVMDEGAFMRMLIERNG